MYVHIYTYIYTYTYVYINTCCITVIEWRDDFLEMTFFFSNSLYWVAKIRRTPYLHRSFPAKEPYN